MRLTDYTALREEAKRAERHRIAEAIAVESRHHYHAPDVRAALLTVSDRVRKGEL